MINQISEMFGHLIQPPYIYGIAAGLILLLPLYLIHYYRRTNQGIVPFKSQGGNIEIAPQTLRGVMQNAANSVEGVEKAACRHFLRRRNLGVSVSIHLRANHRLRDVDNLIKKRIRATLLDQFGMENVEPINIRVSRIIGDPMATIIDETPKKPVYPEIHESDEDDPDADERPYAEETKL